MDTLKQLKAVLRPESDDQQREVAGQMSLCTMLFNQEMLKNYDKDFYGDVAGDALKSYFEEEGLIGEKHPLAHCAVFRGDVLPHFAMQLSPMLGLPPVPLFAYAFVGAPGQDWSLLENSNWLLHQLAEHCFNAFPGHSLEALLPSLTPKGYYSEVGRFMKV